MLAISLLEPSMIEADDDAASERAALALGVE